MNDDTHVRSGTPSVLHVQNYFVQHPNVFMPDVVRDGYFVPGKKRQGMAELPEDLYSMQWTEPANNLLFDVLFAGKSTWEYGDRYTRVRSNAFAIELVTQGRGELRVGRHKCYVLRPGDVFILHPNEQHTYRACSRTPFQKLFVTLSVNTAMHRAILAATPLAELSHVSLTVAMARQVRELMERIIGMVRDRGADARLQVSLLVCELITFLLQAVHQQAGVPALDTRLQAVMTHAIQHLHERLSMSDLAKVAGVTTGHLNRLFLKEVGMRAHEWLLKLRMLYASELMQKTHLAIHEIAARVGYDNPYAFTRAFRHVAGMTPMTYRRRMWRGR